MRHHRRRLLAVVAVLLVAGLLRFGRPALAAACPPCFGLVAVGDNVYVERGASAEDRAHAVAALEDAHERVRRFYGSTQSRPRILVCATSACYRRVGGGGERGWTLGSLAVFLSPRGSDSVIAAHEIAHAELHARLGPRSLIQTSVPAWFDEGLAVVISEDPRYLQPAMGDRDGCLVEPTGDLPVGARAWAHEAGQGGSIYAMAGCRVRRWILAHGGSAAVIDLASRVAAGESFESAAR